MTDDTGRVLYAALHLLDHQLLDRDGYRCGNVDDLEVTEMDDGTLVVTALLAGPGILAERLGHHRFGRWWRQATGAGDDVRITTDHIAEIGADIVVAVDHHEMATARTERWARERVIDHLPGAHRTDQPEES
jgi:sporulation protein YlmC with PRC-barrel domain